MANTTPPKDLPPHLLTAFLTNDIATLYSSWPSHKPSHAPSSSLSSNSTPPTTTTSPPTYELWSTTLLSQTLLHSSYPSLLSALTHHPSTFLSTDLFAAMQDSPDYLSLVKGLLAAGMDPNWQRPNWSCVPLLTDAVETGNAELVKVLLEKGSEVESIPEGERAGLRGVGGGEGGEVRRVVLGWELKRAVEAEAEGEGEGSGGMKGKGGSVKLHAAAFEGDVEEVVRLVKEGADVNAMAPAGKFKMAKTEVGMPLHYAVEARKMDCVRALLDAGARPEALDGEGRSVLERSKVVDGSVWEDLMGLKDFQGT